MNSGEIVLTFPAACAVCRASIPHGVRVWWDAVSGDVSCVGSHIGATSAPLMPTGPREPYDQERSPSQDRRPELGRRESDRWAPDPRRDDRYDPRHDDRYDPRHDGRHDSRFDDRRDPRYDDRLYDDRSDQRVPGRFDERDHDSRASGTDSGRDSQRPHRWDPLDIDAADWWSSFDPGSMAPGDRVDERRVEPLLAPTAVRPEPVTAPLPESAVVEQVERLSAVAPMDDASWTTPVDASRRRHSGLTAAITPGGIAGLPPAHRRTRLTRPRSAWDSMSLLNLALGRSGVMLDRRVAPGDGRPLDHVVIAQSGVWVVTVKSSRGLVERRAGSTMANTRDRLLVDGRERHRALRSAHLRARAVSDTVARLGNGWEQVPVRPVLCYVDAEWRPFAQPFEVDGVFVLWPKQFGAVVNVDPVISPRSVEALATHLDTALRRP
jgi:hypothetical protein